MEMRNYQRPKPRTMARKKKIKKRPKRRKMVQRAKKAKGKKNQRKKLSLEKIRIMKELLWYTSSREAEKR